MSKSLAFIAVIAVVAMLSQRNYYDYKISQIKLASKRKGK